MADAAVEVPYLSAHYSIPEATLTSLTQTPTVELVNELLQSLTKKANEYDGLKADKLHLEVELDNTKHSRDSKIKVLKAAVEKGHAEVEDLRKKLHESENTRSALETEISTLKSSTTSNESDTASLKSRISTLEAEKRESLALLESKSAAHDKLAEELSTLHKKTIELRRELSVAEQNQQKAESASASARFREQSLQQELDLTKKNNEWYETELKTKSAEHLKFRKEKSARISELQRDNEEANSTIDSLRRSENSLKTRLNETEQRYEESLASISQLKEEAIQASESFRVELTATQRLAEVQGTAAKTAKERVEECKLELQKAKDSAAEEISRLRVENETEHTDKQAAERRIAELEATISQLESQDRNRSMSPAHSLNGAGPSTPMRSGTPGGAFTPRASRTKGGLTLTQMYTEYDKMRTQLASEQRNSQELRVAVDEMVQELESIKPELDEAQTDRNRLETAVIEMSDLLETAGKERDNAMKEARKWQGQIEGLAREGDILRQQLRDLSAEVKVLVLEVAVAKQSEDYDREELEKIARQEVEEASAELNPTGRFISQNLTTFKNLHELQEQNLTLRRMLRELGDKMEGEEARAKDAVRQKEVEELKELRIRVQTYQDEIANLLAQSKSYAKERDTFRSMLTHRHQAAGDTSIFSQSVPLGAAPLGATGNQIKDSPDYADLLRKLQAHFDSYREETSTDHTALRQQVNELSRKNSELLSEISRSSSQLAAATSRGELLQSNFNMLKSENGELQKRYSSILENANRQDLRTQQAAEDLVEAKGLIESLQRENANLKAERDLLKTVEKRLYEDLENLRNERSRLDTLNGNMQSMLNEREHTDSENRRRLESTVEGLESELQSTKRKLNEETENSRRATLRRDYEQEQSQKRIDDLMTSLSSVREELVAIKTTKDHLQSRVDELTVELKSAEERLQVLQSRPSVSAAPTEAPVATQDTTDGSGLTREQELSIEVSELKRDLDLAKNELAHSKERVEEYQAISQSTEERMESEAETHAQYREETDRLLEERSKKIQDLETRIEEISTEMSTNASELTKLREEQNEAARHLEEQKANLESEITRLKDDNERHLEAARYHQEDIKAQAEIAQTAQQNYENELVKHADAARNLQAVRAEANQVKLEMVEVRTQAETLKKDLAQKEESWAEQKARYDTELLELQKRREEVLHQNSLLHEQVQGVTAQISALQRDKANFSENDEEGEEMAPNLERQQQLISWLRKEKEILDLQLQCSNSEKDRLQRQFDYTQTQLDETRLKLEQQRRAAADSDQNTLNHNKLMETLNELNLFRESSVTLRNQVKQTETALAEKSARVDELVQQMEPMQTKIHELENLVESKDGEMQLLQADRDHYQKRIQNILQKYDRVDPQEMESLQEKLATLEKERDEAITAREELASARDALTAEIEQNKTAAEARVQELRTKLTEQFKGRSKELSGRINSKQAELTAALQEKEVLQDELNTTKAELETLKTKMSETPAAAVDSTPASTPVPNAAAPVPAEAAPVNPTPASQFPTATTQVVSGGDEQKIKELEAKIQRLEAALAEKDGHLATKDAELEAKLKERSDKLKEMYNTKLNEFKAAQRKEAESMSTGEQSAPATPAPTAEQPPSTPSKTSVLPELTDAQARELLSKNETLRTIMRNNIRNHVDRAKQAQAASGSNDAALSEAQQKHIEELEALRKTLEEEMDDKVKSAVELSDKKSLARISMLDGQKRTAQTRLDVVKKAAEDTPQKPVIEVWEVAKIARPPPVASQAPKPAAVASPAQPASPAPPAAQSVQPAAAASINTTPAVPSPTPATEPTPSPAIGAESTPAETQQAEGSAEQTPAVPVNPFGQQAQQPQQSQQQAPSLPIKPPAHTPPGMLRALQSNLPIARGGGGSRGGRGGAQQPHLGHAQQQPADQQQQALGQSQGNRGSGLPRGRGGRGGQGRGGNQQNQHATVQNQAPSPTAARGGMNPGARQFVPHGNKRTRDEASDTPTDANTSGKRIRGGGGGGQARGGATA
ncbi:hypothetical protein N7532_011993 [Penicillium argentinense]|uniref:Nucleoprotein TPR/MLP1 domain-containing protein n=1 Tax=Penicillium argentinense TaxID=1131581 RepID=A0A9W9JVG4_9EURO|nr:uncharacterized protein N7532_011993 [Penicillium argentinense]KAJ5082950.1 hypothetical protein N7532_011993 [Penicillium argentinense]